MDEGATKKGRPAVTQTRQNGEETRAKIINAAELLFGKRSFDAVSLRDITVEAGVTLALASYHFRTKENLFAAVVSRRAEVLNRIRRERLAERVSRSHEQRRRKGTPNAAESTHDDDDEGQQ